MVRGRAPRLFCCAAVRALGVAVVLACDVAARVGASSSALAPRGGEPAARASVVRASPGASKARTRADAHARAQGST